MQPKAGSKPGKMQRTEKGKRGERNKQKMNEKLKSEIEACRTPAQVKKVLTKYGLTIIRDNSADYNTFSAWIDETTRIYKPYNSKTMVFQKWQKVTLEYSGTPVFFPTGLF